MQGMENAPALVQKCYESLKINLKDREIILITAQNRKEYAILPDYIEEKYRKGIITHTHFSDLLRVELLCKYGGTWIDSTVYCSGEKWDAVTEACPFHKLAYKRRAEDMAKEGTYYQYIMAGFH